MLHIVANNLWTSVQSCFLLLSLKHLLILKASARLLQTWENELGPYFTMCSSGQNTASWLVLCWEHLAILQLCIGLPVHKCCVYTGQQAFHLHYLRQQLHANSEISFGAFSSTWKFYISEVLLSLSFHYNPFTELPAVFLEQAAWNLVNHWARLEYCKVILPLRTLWMQLGL